MPEDHIPGGMVPGRAVDVRTMGRVTEKTKGAPAAEQIRRKVDEDEDNVLLDA
jgi:hypothetical protein